MSATAQLRSLFQELQASASFHRKGVKEAAALLSSGTSAGELVPTFLDCIDRVLAAGTKAPFARFFLFIADCCKQHDNALLNPSLKHMIERSQAKDRFMRTRTLLLLDTLLQSLPDDTDFPAGLFEQLKAAVVRRALDKTIGVRTAAARLLARLQETPAEGGPADPAHTMLLFLLQHDANRDVRLAALQSIVVPPATGGAEAAGVGGAAALSATVSVLVTATQDEDSLVRAAAFTKVASSVPLAALPLSARLSLASAGLCDVDGAVRQAAVLAFAAWLKQCHWDMGELLEALGIGIGVGAGLEAEHARAGAGARAGASPEVAHSPQAERVAEALLCAIFAWVEGPAPGSGSGTGAGGVAGRKGDSGRARGLAAAEAAQAALEEAAEEAAAAGDGDGPRSRAGSVASAGGAGSGASSADEGSVDLASAMEAMLGPGQDKAKPATAADTAAAAASVLASALATSPSQLWARAKASLADAQPTIEDLTVAGALFWRVRAAWLAGHSGLSAPPPPPAAAPPGSGPAPSPARCLLETSARVAALDALLPTPGAWAGMLDSIAYDAGMAVDLEAHAQAGIATLETASGSGSGEGSGSGASPSGEEEAGVSRVLACLPRPATLASVRALPRVSHPDTRLMLRQWLLLGQLLDFGDESGRSRVIAATMQLLAHPFLPAEGAADAATPVLLARVLALCLGCGRPMEAVGVSDADIGAGADSSSHAGAGSDAGIGAGTKSDRNAVSAQRGYLTALGAAATSLTLAAHLLHPSPTAGSAPGDAAVAGSAAADGAAGVAAAAAAEEAARLRAIAASLRARMDALLDHDDDDGDDGHGNGASNAATRQAAVAQIEAELAQTETLASQAEAAAAGGAAAAGLALSSGGAGVTAADAALDRAVEDVEHDSGSGSSSGTSSRRAISPAALARLYRGRALLLLGHAASASGTIVPFALHQAVADGALLRGVVRVAAASPATRAIAAASGLGGPPQLARLLATVVLPALDGAHVASGLALVADLTAVATSAGSSGDGTAAAGDAAAPSAAQMQLLAVRAASAFALAQPSAAASAVVYGALLARMVSLALGLPLGGEAEAEVEADGEAAALRPQLSAAAVAWVADALQVLPPTPTAVEDEAADADAADAGAHTQLQQQMREGAAAAATWSSAGDVSAALDAHRGDVEWTRGAIVGVLQEVLGRGVASALACGAAIAAANGEDTNSSAYSPRGCWVAVSSAEAAMKAGVGLLQALATARIPLPAPGAMDSTAAAASVTATATPGLLRLLFAAVACEAAGARLAAAVAPPTPASQLHASGSGAGTGTGAGAISVNFSVSDLAHRMRTILHVLAASSAACAQPLLTSAAAVTVGCFTGTADRALGLGSDDGDADADEDDDDDDADSAAAIIVSQAAKVLKTSDAGASAPGAAGGAGAGPSVAGGAGRRPQRSAAAVARARGLAAAAAEHEDADADAGDGSDADADGDGSAGDAATSAAAAKARGRGKAAPAKAKTKAKSKAAPAPAAAASSEDGESDSASDSDSDSASASGSDSEDEDEDAGFTRRKTKRTAGKSKAAAAAKGKAAAAAGAKKAQAALDAASGSVRGKGKAKGKAAAKSATSSALAAAGAAASASFVASGASGNESSGNDPILAPHAAALLFSLASAAAAAAGATSNSAASAAASSTVTSGGGDDSWALVGVCPAAAPALAAAQLLATSPLAALEFFSACDAAVQSVPAALRAGAAAADEAAAAAAEQASVAAPRAGAAAHIASAAAVAVHGSFTLLRSVISSLSHPDSHLRLNATQAKVAGMLQGFWAEEAGAACDAALSAAASAWEAVAAASARPTTAAGAEDDNAGDGRVVVAAPVARCSAEQLTAMLTRLVRLSA